ncbi:MAG: anti-sigma factor family protein [Streptosporangiaceae bacterium]
MTIRNSNSVTGCRAIRQLLGVYVVGAIDPAERSVVDDHLAGCQSCRDELAGLAGLPAMLSRVPAPDVERLSLEPSLLGDDPPTPGDLLNSLLRQVSVRRHSRLWRGVITVAAAAAVAAAGATAAVELARPAAQPVSTEVASAASPRTGVAAVVDYARTPWGSTTMRVQVRGIRWGTTCQFWVVGTNGKSYAGTWTVQYGQQAWYTGAYSAAPSSVQSFQITAGSKVLLTIPAS